MVLARGVQFAKTGPARCRPSISSFPRKGAYHEAFDCAGACRLVCDARRTRRMQYGPGRREGHRARRREDPEGSAGKQEVLTASVSTPDGIAGRTRGAV